MAHKYIAYIESSKVPDLAALQAAIKALGFKLTIDEAYVPLKFSGYLPCTLDGEDAGFTLKFDSSDMPGKDTAVTLQSGGDPREDVTVLIIAATMASAFGASVQDGKQQPTSAETLQATALDQFSNLD